MIILLCGLSGAGKTTIATGVKQQAAQQGIPIEVLDGDHYREFLCRDLGFSREDRCENIRRLGFVASRLSAFGIVCIISAINPYAAVRDELTAVYRSVRTVYLDCPVSTLIKRDTKGLYKRALLPDGHPDKLYGLTGINDPFEAPAAPDLHLRTDVETAAACTKKVLSLIRQHMDCRVQRTSIQAPSS